MSFSEDRRILPWLALAGICLAYIGAVWALHPKYYFGLTHDDMLYFTSAKALAENKGYIVPSLPGAPPATKYPVLYPWLLSWVWRWNPSFPANLTGAIWINVFFGLIFILASYRLIQQTQGISQLEALLLVGYCALHPLLLFYAATIMAEVVFAALALTGLILADRAMRRGARVEMAIGCGLVFGLANLVRTAGVPLVLGVLLAALLRRAWRQALAFGICFSPVFVGLFWRSILLVPPAPITPNSSSASGWQQAWLYHTDYLAFRRMASPNIRMIGQFALNQVLYLPSELAGYFLSPLSEKSVIFWFSTTLLLFSTICVGWFRQAKNSQWAPVHLGAAVYILSLMSWDYPDWRRFLLLFLPVITAVLWVQGKSWITCLNSAAHKAPHYYEKLVAGCVVFLFLIVFAAVLWNYAGPSRVWSVSVSQKREKLLPEKNEAYLWLRQKAGGSDHVIAMEDGSVYLNSGLRSMVPIVPLPGGIYDAKQVRWDMDHMMDVAQAISAAYWVASPDDYDNTQKFFRPFLTSRSKELQDVLPVVFKSSGKNVVIFDLECVREPVTPACQSAARVLFPDGIPPRANDSRQGPSHE